MPVDVQSQQLAQWEPPTGIEIVDVCGQRSFAIYGGSGGLAYSVVAYLFKKGDGANPFPEGADLGRGNGIEQLTRGWLLGRVETLPDFLMMAVQQRARELMETSNA